AAAGRPVQDHRRHAIALDREPQRAARADDVLLADELVERRGAQPLRERRDLVEPPACRLAEEVAHNEKYAGARDGRRDPPRPGRERLRALPADGRAARTAETAGGDEPPGRAPLHDRPPDLGALAEARGLRGRRGGRRGPRRGGALPAARGARPPVRDELTRHARADEPVGVPRGPHAARTRFGIRLARVARAPPARAGAVAPLRTRARRARRRRAVRPRTRARAPLPARRGADR